MAPQLYEPVNGRPAESSAVAISHPVPDPSFFEFERDFAESGIRCIPMIVRFKLDACGIKLKLTEWSRMKAHERGWLVTAPCGSTREIADYREALRTLIFQRSGSDATEIPIEERPAWSQVDVIPITVKEKLHESGYVLTLQQWRGLSGLQRFALVKLSNPGHENKNFPKAMAEFGLT